MIQICPESVPLHSRVKICSDLWAKNNSVKKYLQKWLFFMVFAFLGQIFFIITLKLIIFCYYVTIS